MYRQSNPACKATRAVKPSYTPGPRMILSGSFIKARNFWTGDIGLARAAMIKIYPGIVMRISPDMNGLILSQFIKRWLGRGRPRPQMTSSQSRLASMFAEPRRVRGAPLADSRRNMSSTSAQFSPLSARGGVGSTRELPVAGPAPTHISPPAFSNHLLQLRNALTRGNTLLGFAEKPVLNANV